MIRHRRDSSEARVASTASMASKVDASTTQVSEMARQGLTLRPKTTIGKVEDVNGKKRVTHTDGTVPVSYTHLTLPTILRV